MDRSELLSQLERWCAEFASITERPVPSGVAAFIAERMSERLANFVTEDWDVVEAEIAGKVKRVRITGRTRGRIAYEGADPSDPSFGYTSVASVKDNEKLARIFDKLEGTTP